MKLSLFCLTVMLLFFLFVPPVHAQSQRPAGDNRARTASISGRITIGGKPAVNSTVSVKEVIREIEGGKMGAVGQRFFAKVRTDTDGRYRFPGLAEGQYSIIVLSRAYISKGKCREGDSCRDVTLDDGEALENVDFTFVRGGVITGRVVDAEDRPVIASEVLLLRVNEKGGPEAGYIFGGDQAMETDDRGVYRLYGLPAGRYIIGVGGGRFYFRAMTRLPVTFYPDVTDQKQAKVIEVKEAEVVENIDIRIAPTRKTYEALGRVVDADNGQAIPNARLHCETVSENEAWMEGNSRTVITNDQGQFTMTGLISGRYELKILNDWEETVGYYCEKTLFVVNDRDVSALEIKAIRGSMASGIVVVAGVTDPAIKLKLRQAIVFASILGDRDPAIADGPAFSNVGNSSSKIGAEGVFRFNGLPPGKLVFRLYGYGIIPFMINRIERDGATINHPIEIRRGERVENLQIVVDYANGSIRGQVKIVGGNLPQGWRLQVYASRKGTYEKSYGLPPFISEGGYGQVDEKGRFLIERLAPGDYEVGVNAVGRNNADGAEAVKQRATINNGTETSVTITYDPTRRRQEEKQ